MKRTLQRDRWIRLARIVFLGLAAATAAHAQERADCREFRSAILHASVRYCVFLPANYSAPQAQAQRYPVLYLLHGLGGNAQAAAVDGEWNALQDLRRDRKVGDFLVVAPDGWDTFYINSRDGKTLYGDFFLREFMPLIERTTVCAPGAPPAELRVSPWEATEHCGLRLAIRNCSAPLAPIARP